MAMRCGSEDECGACEALASSVAQQSIVLLHHPLGIVLVNLVSLDEARHCNNRTSHKTTQHEEGEILQYTSSYTNDNTARQPWIYQLSSPTTIDSGFINAVMNMRMPNIVKFINALEHWLDNEMYMCET